MSQDIYLISVIPEIMSAWGIFSFAIGGALGFLASVVVLGSPWGVVIGFIAFLFIGIGLEEIISSSTRQERRLKQPDLPLENEPIKQSTEPKILIHRLFSEDQPSNKPKTDGDGLSPLVGRL